MLFPAVACWLASLGFESVAVRGFALRALVFGWLCCWCVLLAVVVGGRGGFVWCVSPVSLEWFLGRCRVPWPIEAAIWQLICVHTVVPDGWPEHWLVGQSS